MYRPQKLVAALFGAALLCTTGMALADKGGNHDKHGGSSAQSAPGSSNNSNSKAASQRGPGGIGGPQSAPGPFERGGMRGSEFEGNVDAASKRGSMGASAAINVRLSSGGTRTFGISDAALNALKKHQGRGDLIFFTTNSSEITAISARGEKSNMRVVARSGDTFTLEGNDGQTRVITLDSKTASRLQVKVGCHLQVTTNSATSGRIVALDLEKKHSFDKFSRKSDIDVAKLDVDRQKVDADTKKLDVDRAKAKSTADMDVAKLDMDRRDVDIDQEKLDIDKAKGKKADVDVDQQKLDADRKQCDRDVALAEIDRAKTDIDTKAKKAKKADVDIVKADIDAVKSDVDTADTKKSKKLDKDIAKLDNDQRKLDLDVANGGCGRSASRSGNPAFANQMAKDAANDISGHNPPGLPHECVNPAGHTRGFCKSSSSGSMCGGGGETGGGSGIAPTETQGGIANAPARRFAPTGNVTRGPGSPVGFIPVGGGTYAPSGSGTRGPGAASGPTHVLGASTGPTTGRRIAALPTRVLPVAIQPVGKRRCVWYKTGVLGASSGPYRVIGTSANGKPVLHKKCR